MFMLVICCGCLVVSLSESRVFIDRLFMNRWLMCCRSLLVVVLMLVY